ncbi:MAG: Ppx/GppA family phosphatase [Pseudomonadota bacterium]
MTSKVSELQGARPRARRDSRRFKGRIAVVDIGSNSIRLVVFDRLSRVPVPVFNERVICGLGKGLAATGRVSEEGVALALPNLLRFARLAQAMEVADLVLLATAAVRDAANGADFVTAVEKTCGAAVRVLDGAQEATLAAYGVLVGAPKANGLAGDLGGGSLELIELNQGRLGRRVTVPLGPLRLMDASDSDRERAAEIVTETLATVPWLGPNTGGDFHAVGGAWRNLARVHMEQGNYPLHVIQGYTLDAQSALDVAAVIAQQGRRSLAKMNAVSRRRVETLPFAAITLCGLLRMLQPDRIVFSAFGLREGLLYERLSRGERAKDPLLVTAEEISRREGRFPHLGDALLTWCRSIFLEQRKLEPRLLAAACHLADVAWREHPDYRARQALNRLLYYPYAGLDHPGRAFLALSAYQRYGSSGDDELAAPARSLLTPVQQQEAKLLGLALRLAISVCGGAAPILERTSLEADGGTLRLTLPADGELPPGDALQRRLTALAQAMNLAGTEIRQGEEDGPFSSTAAA